MNRRNVRIGAVVCSAGVVIGGITLATQAIGAPTPLALSNGATSFTIANLGHAAAADANAGYALKLTDAGSSTTNKFILNSAPTGGTLSLTRTTANAASGTTPTANLTTGSPVTTTSLGAVADTDLVYVTADVPGTYKLQAFQDTNGSNTIDADSERASAEITVTVYDATNNTAGVTGDDVAPVITAASPSDIGTPVKAGITYNKALTLTDARGAGSTGLQARLAALTFVDIIAPVPTGITASTDNAAAYSSGTTSFTAGTPTAAGTVSLRADLKPTGATDGTLASQYGAKDVTVQSNLVNGVTAVAAKDANHTAAGKIRPGTATTTFSATVTTSSGSLAGKVVHFTLTPGTNAPVLSVGGSVVASGAAGTVDATTDASGVASITVSSSVTTATTAYTVAATTNSQTPSTVSAVYEAATGTATLDKTLSAQVGGSVTVTGTIKDQYGQTFSPTSSQATVTVTRGGGGTFTRTVDVTNGSFTASIPDTATTNTAPRSDTFTVSFSGGAATTVTGGSIKFLSSVAPSSITFNSLSTTAGGSATTFPFTTGNTATVDITGNTTVDSETVVATVKNSAGEALQGADFTLTAGAGAYFLDSSGKAVTSFSGKTNPAGEISDDGTSTGVDVFFTSPGTNQITVTAGGKTASTGNFTVEDATAAYSVELSPTVGLTNKNVIIKGKVVNSFGFGVKGVTPDLDLSTNTLGNIISGPTASDSAGNFTAILVSGDSTGNADVTATVSSATDAAAGPYAGTGLTTIKAQKSDKQALRIIAEGVTAQAVARRIGPGPVDVTGVAAPGSTVDVYSRPLAGGSYAKVATTTADTDGQWKYHLTISQAVSIKAVSGSKESTPISVNMNSKLQANAVALGGGKVKVAIAGYPGVKDSGILLQEAQNGKLVTVGTLRSDSRGVGKITWTTTPGTHTLKAVYKAPGTNQGSVVISFTVN